MEDLFEAKMDQLIDMTTRGLDGEEIFMSLFFTGVMAFIIYVSYRLAHTRNTYKPEFAVTLTVIAFVSTILMDLVQSNLALSLGMLGSLSIVRFRTNIADPRDIGFVVWSMATGIAAATANYVIGITGCTVLAFVMILTKRSEKKNRPMLLVVRGSNADINSIENVASTLESCRLKAKNILSDSFEIVYEVNVSDRESNRLIENMFEIGGIDSVNLLAQKTLL